MENKTAEVIAHAMHFSWVASPAVLGNLAALAIAANLTYLSLERFRYRKRITGAAAKAVADLAGVTEKELTNIHPFYKDLKNLANGIQAKPTAVDADTDNRAGWVKTYHKHFLHHQDRRETWAWMTGALIYLCLPMVQTMIVPEAGYESIAHVEAVGGLAVAVVASSITRYLPKGGCYKDGRIRPCAFYVAAGAFLCGVLLSVITPYYPHYINAILGSIAWAIIGSGSILFGVVFLLIALYRPVWYLDRGDGMQKIALEEIDKKNRDLDEYRKIEASRMKQEVHDLEGKIPLATPIPPSIPRETD